MEFEDFVSIELERLVVGMTMTLRDIRFEKSSADLAGKFQPELEQLARTLNQSDIRIQITGHTDADGSAERNMELSEQRAAAVARFLTSRGVDQNRMDLAGKGSSMPIASNETDEGKMLNRRTEIMVVK
jgi:outer membrane protein OmpA-like peptidoglycan-associated protein